ncbi:MAG: PDZ domain-containing protein [Planctomycetes bacterium]|nr:PDZ domain-containing protein [Planctomycetota bacterium]
MWTGLIACLALLPQTAPPQAWVGVSMAVHGEKIEVEQQTFPHGIRLIDVLSDSPAEAAGLLTGDVIVTMSGVDFDCPADELLERFRAALKSHDPGDTISFTVFRDTVEQQATLDGKPFEEPVVWDNPGAALESRPPGTRLELVVQRVRGLRTVTVELVARPENPGSVHVIPANEQIFEHPVPLLPTEQLAEALIDHFAARDDYRDLRARLAGLVAEGDEYRLSRFAYAMREPFAMPNLARQIADVPQSLPGLLAHGGTWLDLPPEQTRAPRLQTGLSVQEHAAQIAAVLSVAQGLHERAFAGLSAEERTFLRETVSAMGSSFVENIMIERDGDRERLKRVKRLCRLAAKVDTARLAEAAIRLTPLLETSYLKGLRKDLSGATPGIILKHDTELGPIVFAGPGDDWHREPAAVIVDLGGDDFYTNQMQSPFSIVVDLDGNDTHQATFEFAQGCGLLGIALLYDHAGDDRYLARRWAQGSAAVGVGVLYDRQGNDTYRGAEFSQGAAFRGVGLLIDAAGDDRYEAPRCAQALGLPGGFAGLIERGGNDHYYCGGRDLSTYGTQGIFEGWGQGCASGFRGVASGGIALLLDERGDDVYEAGNFSQGGGYYFGWGCLVDRAGSDRYLGSRYAQAFAAHQAMGFLEDHAGDDFYQNRMGVGQSCSWDQTVTVLLDHAGDDVYSCGGFALAAAAHNGFALLVDYAGRDNYVSNQGRARASGNDYHGGTSFALLLDLGGADDRYAAPGANASIRHHDEHAFFADVPGDLSEAVRAFQQWIRE